MNTEEISASGFYYTMIEPNCGQMITKKYHYNVIAGPPSDFLLLYELPGFFQSALGDPFHEDFSRVRGRAYYCAMCWSQQAPYRSGVRTSAAKSEATNCDN